MVLHTEMICNRTPFLYISCTGENYVVPALCLSMSSEINMRCTSYIELSTNMKPYEGPRSTCLRFLLHRCTENVNQNRRGRGRTTAIDRYSRSGIPPRRRPKSPVDVHAEPRKHAKPRRPPGTNTLCAEYGATSSKRSTNVDLLSPVQNESPSPKFYRCAKQK